MAVSTNLGLYLPTRDDYISVQRDLSSNYEIIDEHAGMMENGIAIVINGDTAPKAITAGQYLFIKNHSTLATGGYHATANIALGATISNSNVAADADGIANALNSKFATFSDANGSGAPTDFVSKANVATKTVYIRGVCSGLTLNAGYTIFNNVINSPYVPSGDTAISAFNASFLVNAYISRTGSLIIYTPSAQSNVIVTFGGAYLID